MLEAGFKALDDCADIMVDIAKRMVPVDTGTLQKSIRKEIARTRDPKKKVIIVCAGGNLINPKTGRLCDYASFVEARHPFMAPAFETVKPVIEERIRNAVVARVNP